MDLAQFHQIGTIFTVIASIGGGLWGLVKIYKFFSKVIVAPVSTEYKRITGLHRDLEIAVKSIKEIRTEFSPNGGSSLRDSVNLLHSRISINDAKTDALIERSDLATFESDANGKLTSVNRGFCNLIDVLPNQALGDGWLSGVHEEDRARVEQEWRDSVSQKREFFCKARLGNPKTDSYKNATICSQIIRGRGGEAKGLFGYVKVS